MEDCGTNAVAGASASAITSTTSATTSASTSVDGGISETGGSGGFCLHRRVLLYISFSDALALTLTHRAAPVEFEDPVWEVS